MWVLIEKSSFCCLDLPNIGTVPPNWLHNATCYGTDIIGKSGLCYHWHIVKH